MATEKLYVNEPLSAGFLFCYGGGMKPFLLALTALLFCAAPAAAQNTARDANPPCTQNCPRDRAAAPAPETFDPNAIEPAAGAEQAIDPSTAEDPFALKPFEQDPFAPETLPGIND